MPRKPVRDWITSEEAASLLEISGARFRDFLVQEVRERYLPNSVLVTRTWLHYIGDVKRLKQLRENYPPRSRPRKRTRKTPVAESGTSQS